MQGGKRNFAHDKLARLYDAEIRPIWTERFARVLLREIQVPTDRGAQILELGCGTGHVTEELLRRLGDKGRIIALEPSTALLNVARTHLDGKAPNRLFFRSDSQLPRLRFADDVYDLVVSNLALADTPEGSPDIDTRAGIGEMARVAAPGGRVACTLPMHGTWDAFLDIMREVLVKDDSHEELKRLAEFQGGLPDEQTATEWLTSAGLVDPRVEIDSFELLFRSSREFFYAPVVEYGPLATWKSIAGKGDHMQDVFWAAKQAIDTYFGDRAFAVKVNAGCLSGTKPS